MKNYKSPTNQVYAYESDGSQDHLIPANFVPITDEEALLLNQQREKEAFDNLPYADKRAMAYPDFREYLDGVVKGDQTQIDKYIADCLAVKNKYPKPQS